MSNQTIRRKQGDTGPPVDDILRSDGSADDLSGATVAFSLWNDSETKISEDTTNVTVEDATNGEVEYQFAPGDLDTADLYYYEWEVTFASGEVRTYPNQIEGVPLLVVEQGVD